MAEVTYSPTTYTGEHFTEFFMDVLFANKTLRKKLVRLIDDIKYRLSLSEVNGGVTIQAYTPGKPSAAGSIGIKDRLIEPKKATVFFTYDPNEVFRKTWFAKSLPQGVENIESNEGNQMILARAVADLAKQKQALFWGGFSSAFKTAVAAAGNAALTSAGEKTYVAARSTNLPGIDGVIAKMILETLTADPANPVEAVPTLLVSSPAVVDSSTIIAEYLKTYTLIPDETLHENDQEDDATSDAYSFFAPYSHKKIIETTNKNQTYRDYFGVNGDKYTFQNVNIEFVPMPTDSTMVFGKKEDLIWGTDLTPSNSTEGSIVIGPDDNFSHLVGVRIDFTQQSQVMNASQKVLHLA